ncbi:MAG: bifunctional phosphopantothenoylcysteine decarboxylase/phosphopantothenate--cysteine ligase CoaBC [Gemmatimonadaceae bacterium]|nr:bifunctional phosphopantothenoylcysteine decarboxylase/phosphopantothenate--cysteine ligase CoaBC [Gemmatimonadaceae bacterium]MDQ3519619.1 bifunctional phosphopantothenoylcysteine decarboxylase/phosphopantothenate--cysteine ligase CoaBC [Gemmatimonadota bacterium]
MRPYDGRRILLGVSGGIASYKSAWLARLLAQAGAEVDVVLTKGASEFITSLTFEGLTGRPVHSDIFAAGHALDHIRLPREASAIVIAPATADLMARAAHGHADDLLTACLLAAGDPGKNGVGVLFVPAMNDQMWSHPQTRANALHLREIGYQVLDPEEGMLAAGEGSGPGRMPEPETILAHIGRMLEPHTALALKHVVVTAGSTREAIDPVRFLSNRSSGKMGVAIAAAAWRRGAGVTLITGPLEVKPPTGVFHVRVESTEEMAAAVRSSLPTADALIMAAAPADYTSAAKIDRKMKRTAAPLHLELAPTADILRDTSPARKNGAVIVGFALETNDVLAEGRRKRDAKDLDLIVVNDAHEPGAGFGTDTNRVTLIARDGTEELLPLMRKTELADIILDRVEARLGAA